MSFGNSILKLESFRIEFIEDFFLTKNFLLLQTFYWLLNILIKLYDIWTDAEYGNISFLLPLKQLIFIVSLSNKLFFLSNDCGWFWKQFVWMKNEKKIIYFCVFKITRRLKIVDEAFHSIRRQIKDFQDLHRKKIRRSTQRAYTLRSGFFLSFHATHLIRLFPIEISMCF